jgi:hypothetical protein
MMKVGALSLDCDKYHIIKGIHRLPYYSNEEGHAVAQLVEALRYKPGSLEFFIDIILSVDSASDRNE